MKFSFLFDSKATYVEAKKKLILDLVSLFNGI